MIDWDRVDELREEVGEEDFDEIVCLFLNEVAETIARLKALPKGASPSDDLHFLKGSALNLGFNELGRLCTLAESNQRASQRAGVDLAALFEVYDKSLVAFQIGGPARSAA